MTNNHPGFDQSCPDAPPGKKSPMFEEVTRKLYESDPYTGYSPVRAPDCRLITDNIFDILIDSVRPQAVLELGTWKGASAIHMAKLLDNYQLDNSILVCIDTWLGSPEHWLNKTQVSAEWGYANLKVVHGRPTMYDTFLSNVVHSNVQHRVIPLSQTSENGCAILKRLGLRFDLIYVDGAHEFGAVMRDLTMCAELLTENGVIFGDDYPAWPGVQGAVNAFAKQGGLEVFAKPGDFVLLKKGRTIIGLEKAGLCKGVVEPPELLIERVLAARCAGNEEDAKQHLARALRFFPRPRLIALNAKILEDQPMSPIGR